MVPERPERVARPRRLSKYIDPSLQGISSWDIFLLFITLTAPVWCVKGDDAKKKELRGPLGLIKGIKSGKEEL